MKEIEETELYKKMKKLEEENDPFYSHLEALFKSLYARKEQYSGNIIMTPKQYNTLKESLDESKKSNKK